MKKSDRQITTEKLLEKKNFQSMIKNIEKIQQAFQKQFAYTDFEYLYFERYC